MLRSGPLAVTAATAFITAFLWLPMAHAQQAVAINRGVVEIETTGSADVSVRIAEDLARLVDDGATRRVVPVVGKGTLQNLADLKFLRGIDLAIVQADVVDYAKDQRLLAGIESITYVTKLYNKEFHLLVRPEIRDIADLAKQKVNVGLVDSDTAITASRLFDLLKLNVTATHDSQQVALDKLRKGEIAALAFVAGKPAPLFAGLTSEDQLHFVAVPFTHAASALYAPTRLTAADYPGLVAKDQPIDTVAVGSILAAADLHQIPERYRNVTNFVDAFFTGFQSLLAPGNHPKWQDVNLAASLPGWRRYPPADEWLQRNAQVANIQNVDSLKAMFSRFIDERRLASGGAPMSDQDKANLFQQFQSWRTGQTR